MDWPASDASVYAMIPFRKLRRSVSTENGDISRGYNADTTPIRIGVSRTAIYGHILVLGTQPEPPAKWGLSGNLPGPAYARVTAIPVLRGVSGSDHELKRHPIQ
jgi:hypothetical protein